MLAFHSDPALKTFVLDQLTAHREADKLVKGTYWQGGKGCAVGCTLEAVRLHNGKFKKGIAHESHALFESELGIPIILARLEDRFFENLPNGESQTWPERFTRAIKPGADLTMIWPRFAVWLLTEEVPPHTKNQRSLASLAEVGKLYREWIEGVKPSTVRWLSARRTAAASAADYAAYAAAYAADAADYAAASAAYVADYAADYVADYAAAYAAASAADYAADYADAYAAYAADYAAASPARIASYRRQSDKLIELLEVA